MLIWRKYVPQPTRDPQENGGYDLKIKSSNGSMDQTTPPASLEASMDLSKLPIAGGGNFRNSL